MNTKTEKPKGARRLMVTLAIAFFTLSVVALLANSGFALYPADHAKRTGKSCQFWAVTRFQAITTSKQEWRQK